MSTIQSLVDLARKVFSAGRRPMSRRADLERQSLGHGILAVEELEDRAMLALLTQQLFPADYPWNQNIANAPVAANSAAVIAHIGSSIGIHPDWGEDSPANGASPLYGIPYNVVHGNTTAKINVIIDNYPGESDVVPVPIPAGAVIEGDFQNGPNPNGGGYNSGQRGDSHLLVWDEDTNTAYELYGVTRPTDPKLFPNTSGVELAHTDGLWHAAQESVWHMSADSFRTLGDTSADAAGLSILAGLVRPDEGLPTSAGGQGAINHALRLTLPSGDVASQYIYPASHVVNDSAGSTKLPFGAQLRLEDTPAINAQINAMGPEAQIIAHAMQQYGLVLADIGSSMYVTGSSASQDANNNIALTWNMDDVLGLHGLTAGDFQVVNLTPIVTGLSATSGAAGNTITINGQNFSGAAGHLAVFFGTTPVMPATSITYISDTQIRVVVPSGTGTVHVTVQSGVNETDPNNPADNVNNPIFGYGTSATSAADLFTFGSQTVSGTNSTAAFAHSTVTAGSNDTLTIVVKDGSGNAVSGLANSAFSFGLTGGTSAGTFGTVTETATPGTYTTTFTGTIAGTQSTLSTTVNGVSLATKTITVSVPVRISGLYVKSSSWTSAFNTYIGANNLGSSSLGYLLQTGATQLTTLPFANIDTIDIQFSGPVSGITTGSLKLVGGTGGGATGAATPAPSITSVSSLGGNAYQVSLSGSMGNNKYVFAVASTNSSFGPAVVDGNGAGIDGEFTTSSSTFATDGNGLAGGTFDFAFNVLPGDGNQNALVNTTDRGSAVALVNKRTTTAGYNPYYDYNGAGLINSVDSSLDARDVNDRQTSITGPTAPAASQGGGIGMTGLALGAQESDVWSNVLPMSTVSNVVPASSPLLITTSSSTTSIGTSSTRPGVTTTSSDRDHGRHQLADVDEPSRAATDAVVADFDLADLYV